MKFPNFLLLAAALCTGVSVKAQDAANTRAIQDVVNTVSRKGSVTLTAAQKTGMADWLKVFGESITNVHPWKVTGEGPAMKDSTATTYAATDFKFTEGKDAIYVFAMNVPTGDMKIKSLCTQIEGKIIGTVTLMGSNERMSWEQEERELNLEKPHVLPKEGPVVFKITWTEYYKERPADKTIKILEN